MAISPVSGALSQTQLQVLEQIRAMRAAKPAVPTPATAPIRSAAPVEPMPLATQPAPQPLATAAATASPLPANRPRGSILNITV